MKKLVTQENSIAPPVLPSEPVLPQPQIQQSQQPVKRQKIAVADIAATPSTITFSHKEGYPQKREITVLGIRGGIYSNVILSNAVIYNVSDFTNIKVETTDEGKVFVVINDGVVGQTVIINAVYHDTIMGALTDTIKVVVVK